jgi:RNA polymerase sigma-70 factor (ECF subfamily)
MTTQSEQELQQHRPYLMRYALLQLRNTELAEDVVQETLLAALEGLARFSGNSSKRTWLTGILKHKIIDALRRKSREQPLTLGDDESEADVIDAMFSANGHWHHFPANWGDPEKSLENAKFREIFEICCGLMPERAARAFMMREVMEMNSGEICKELEITQTNLWVILHRARLSLRECLEIKWLGTRTN